MASTLIGAAEADPSIRFAFSDLADGNMSRVVGPADPRARARLASAVGVGIDDLVFMRQVHGSDVAVVGPDERGRGLGDHTQAVGPADALVTFDPGVALVVQVADCVPVLLWDPGRAVAAVHAGRGGVEADVVDATLRTMAAPAPDRVTAVIGPAIGGCCYEVEAELAERVAASVPAAGVSPVRTTTTWGTPSLDLVSAVAAQLTAAGVGDVRHEGGCTRCVDGAWFSHRRDPHGGRQAGAIVRGRRHA